MLQFLPSTAAFSVNPAPFELTSSYHFARAKSAYVKQTKWDIAAIDEAHHLRNVYKSSNKGIGDGVNIVTLRVDS